MVLGNVITSFAKQSVVISRKIHEIATVVSLPRNDKFCYEYCAAKYNNLMHRVITSKRGRSNPIKLCDFDASLAMTKQIETVTSFPRNCTCHYELCEAKRSNLLKKCAFTLAEVLITLGIIGVVAAMTLPVLVNKYQEIVTVNKVRKTYSVINQVLLMSIKDNGYPSEWSISNSQSSTSAKQLAQYLLPYMKIIKDCGVNTGCLKYTDNIKMLNNITHINYDTNTIFYKVILADNSYLWFRSSRTYCNNQGYPIENSCFAILFDINGPKPPNTVGIDIFGNDIDKDGKIGLHPDDCTTGSDGWGCGGYILVNKNMNYLKK